MAEDFVIEMLHITKEFPGIKANDDITLQLRKGEVHACGRSIVLFKAGHPVTGCPAFFFVFYWRNAGKMQRTLREKSTKVILLSVLSAKKQKRHVQIAANQV